MSFGDVYKKLEFAHKLREFHHKAIWEEEKHFAWWISIFFGAQIIIIGNASIELLLKSILITLCSLIGVLLCTLAYLILKKEGEYFYHALCTFVPLHNYILEPKIPKPKEKANLDFWELVNLFNGKRRGGRDLFLFLFICLGFVFILILIATWLTYFAKFDILSNASHVIYNIFY